MEYTSVTSPIWANAEKTIINCDVNFNDLKENFVPFSASLTDDYTHSIAIFNECMSGNYGVIADYIAPIIIPPSYKYLRAAEYPAYTDYLDGIVKGDLVQQQTYIDACLAVKAKYPKV